MNYKTEIPIHILQPLQLYSEAFEAFLEISEITYKQKKTKKIRKFISL